MTKEAWQSLLDEVVKEGKRTNANKACGVDGIHPSSVKRMLIDPEILNRRELVEDALTRKEGCLSRVTLVPKPNGKKRPIQSSNVCLKLWRRSAQENTRSKQIDNPDDIHGFRKDHSTHTAYQRTLEHLEKLGKNCPQLLADFRSAYNVIREKLNKVIKEKFSTDYPAETDLVLQIVQQVKHQDRDQLLRYNSRSPSRRMPIPYAIQLLRGLLHNSSRHNPTAQSSPMQTTWISLASSR